MATQPQVTAGGPRQLLLVAALVAVLLLIVGLLVVRPLLGGTEEAQTSPPAVTTVAAPTTTTPTPQLINPSTSLNAVCADGLAQSRCAGTPRMRAISSVTLGAGSSPPRPGLAP